LIKADKISLIRNDKKILNEVSFSTREKEILAVIGPNGAGKTTTIKIMLGMLDNFEGEVTISGQKIDGNNIEYKRKIGYVPEGAQLYETLTGNEYLEFIGKIYELDKLVIENRSQKLAELFGIDKDIHSRISSYSKGMKQKLLIIAAIIHNPEIIFLDEPLNGLDANSVMVFKELLTKLAAAGKTIFYSSHLMDVVEKISNRIVLLNNGTVVADGSFEELQAKMEEGSLEEIFNTLTGFHQHQQIAEDIVELLES